jgi:hypothetical protein
MYDIYYIFTIFSPCVHLWTFEWENGRTCTDFISIYSRMRVWVWVCVCVCVCICICIFNILKIYYSGLCTIDGNDANDDFCGEGSSSGLEREREWGYCEWTKANYKRINVIENYTLRMRGRGAWQHVLRWWCS